MIGAILNLCDISPKVGVIPLNAKDFWAPAVQIWGFAILLFVKTCLGLISIVLDILGKLEIKFKLGEMVAPMLLAQSLNGIIV